MATKKTEEEVENDRLAKAAEADKEELDKRLAANSATDAIHAAAADKRDVEVLQHNAELANPEEVEEGEFPGQIIYTDNFIAVTSETFGRAAVEIKPVGWVGPGFIVGAVRIKELGELVGKIKNLPKE